MEKCSSHSDALSAFHCKYCKKPYCCNCSAAFVYPDSNVCVNCRTQLVYALKKEVTLQNLGFVASLLIVFYGVFLFFIPRWIGTSIFILLLGVLVGVVCQIRKTRARKFLEGL